MTRSALALLGLSLTGFGAFGCEGPALFSDLARSLIPEREDGYEKQGRRVASGDFRSLGLEFVPPSYDFALAIDDDDALLIAPISGGAPCTIADVESYQPAIWRSFDFDEARLPFRRAEAEGRALYFTDFQCNVSRVSVPGGRVVDYVPLPEDRGVLVEGEGRHIYAVSPWLEKAVDLGERILSETHPFRFSLLTRRGKLILYDAFAEPLTSVGSDVVDARLLPNESELILLEADGALAAVPLDEDSGEVTWLADDACELFDAGELGNVVGFYSPCGAKRLVLYRPGAAGAPGETFPLVVDASNPRIVRRSLQLEANIDKEALSAVFFRNQNPDTGVGELWAQSADQAPYRLGRDIADLWMLPAFDRDADERSVVALALEVDSGSKLNLVALDGEQRVELASDVSALYESGSLVVVSGAESGGRDLVLLESQPLPEVYIREPELLLSNALGGIDIARTRVLEGVQDEAYVRAAEDFEELSLFRTDEAHEHTLYLLRQSMLDGAFDEPLRLLSGAGGQYAFSAHVPSSVLSLVETAGPGSSLYQYWYDTDLEATIGDRVSSFYESSLVDHPALLYATVGADAGLYYVGLR